METGWEDFSVVEEILEIVLAFDENGKILFANKAATEKLSYMKEELQQFNMAELFWQEFQRENGKYAPFDKAVLMEKEETVMYRKNSSCFPVAVRFFTSGDGISYLLAEDITWRKNMDVRIRQLKEEEETNRQVRNEFTANVTHELRTPVNGIKGHVLTLLDAVENPEQRKTLEIILYCCDNMSAIINSILDFSKLEAGRFVLEESEFDFYKMMDKVIATHIAQINKKELHLSVYIDENIPQLIIGDELRVVQILNNLLSNAIKFTLVGQISIDVSMTMQIQDEVELFFMIKDTGIGMTKEEQDKVFQSFQQVDASITRRFGGTGLGLSITKQLVEMMNGSIHVDSEKGRGSSFSFNIKMRTSKNAGESRDLREIYQNFENLTTGVEEEKAENFFTFGSDENIAEVKKKMEKLLLSIELGSWEKAETLSETLKALTQTPEGDMKKQIFKMEMAIRKENYDKSMEMYEQIKTMLEERWENARKDARL